LLAYNNLGPNPILSIGDALQIVPPTAVPTATALPTQTPIPATATPTLTPEPTVTRLAVAQAAAPAETKPAVIQEANAGLNMSGNGALIAGAGLLLIGLVAIIAAWRRM
jgi:hypothetical protein